tara:strand:- start:1654 stop:2919 length:1266 start_codon:yes stop_codon:yes gene_type:complete
MFLRVLGAFLVLAVAATAQADSPQEFDRLIDIGDMPALAEALARDGVPSVNRELAIEMAQLSLSGAPVDVDRVSGWIEQTDGLSDDQRRGAFRALAERAFLETRYADAAAALEHALAFADDEARADIAPDLALYRVASLVAPVRVTSAAGTTVPITRDMANQMRVDLRLEDSASVPFLVDTGAEISVIMDRHARTAGLRFLEGEVQVGTVTEDVTGRLAVADRVQIGDMIVRNVVFLVLPDDMLTFSDGDYTADGILGLQVFAAAGRMGWSQGGGQLALGEAVPVVDATNLRLYWHSGGLGLEIWRRGHPASAFFDSGASRTIFRPGLLAHLDDEERARLVRSSRTRAGVGGEEAIETQMLDTLALTIGGSELIYQNLTIDPPEEDLPAADIAAIGNDLVQRVDRLNLDFRTMRYQVILSD